MSRRSNTPSIGFFGLNGAKILLGLTIFFIVYTIINSLFDFVLFKAFRENLATLPTPILTLILAFVIACASLFGIITGEILDNIIVTYWRGVNRTRLIKFEDNITNYIETGDTNDFRYDRYPEVYLYHLFLNGDIWKDRYFLSYRQEFMIRLILVLTLFLAGFFILVIGVHPLISNSTLVDFSIFLALIIVATALLFVSIREKTEVSRKEAIQKLFARDFVTLYLMTLPIFTHIILWILDQVSIVSFDKFNYWITIAKVICVILSLLLIPLANRQSIIEIYNGLEQTNLDDNQLFGDLTSNQWYNLIVCYYELFFYRRYEEELENKHKLSKLDTYLFIISAVYTYKVIYTFFTGDIETKMPQSNQDELFPLQQYDLSYIDSFNKMIALIEGELAKDNFDRAIQLFKALDEEILRYFATNLTLPNSKENNNNNEENHLIVDMTFKLILEAPPIYILKSSKAEGLISKVDNPNTLERILVKITNMNRSGRLDSWRGEYYSILGAIVDNRKCTRDWLRWIITENSDNPDNLNKLVREIHKASTLEKILDDIYDLDIESSSRTLSVIAENKYCSTATLERILRNSRNIDVNLLNSVAKNTNCTPDILDNVLMHPTEVNWSTLKLIAEHENNTLSTLDNILHGYPEKINSNVLTSITERLQHISYSSEIHISDSEVISRTEFMSVLRTWQGILHILHNILIHHSERIETTTLTYITNTVKNVSSKMDSQIYPFPDWAKKNILDLIIQNKSGLPSILASILNRHQSNINDSILNSLVSTEIRILQILRGILIYNPLPLEYHSFVLVEKSIEFLFISLESILSEHSEKLVRNLRTVVEIDRVLFNLSEGVLNSYSNLSTKSFPSIVSKRRNLISEAFLKKMDDYVRLNESLQKSILTLIAKGVSSSSAFLRMLDNNSQNTDSSFFEAVAGNEYLPPMVIEDILKKYSSKVGDHAFKIALENKHLDHKNIKKIQEDHFNTRP